MPTKRERILGCTDVRTTQVDCQAEWGETITVRNLTAEEQERWWDILNDHREKGVDPDGGRKASVVGMACIDEDGKDLFAPEDVAALGKKHPLVIQRLFDAIRDLSEMTKEAQADAEKKRSEAANSSSTGSPTDSESGTSTTGSPN